jgi:hypothetical protein
MAKPSSLHLGEAVAVDTASLWAHKLPSVLTLLGMECGVYPASKAAKLDPVEALRYE